MKTLAILGVGLLGGSVARAARQRRIVEHITGYDPQRSSLDHAVSIGLIDRSALTVGEAVRDADLVIAAAPVDHVVPLLQEAAAASRPGTLLTDVGSTKATLVRTLEAKLPPNALFVGSHPLAGSEKHGPEHADANLFSGRTVFLTPTPRTNPAALTQARSFWEALDARVRILSPEEHDQTMALTSHLPQLAAAALAGTLPQELCDLTGTGFRDTTRLASGNPDVWRPIFEQNRGPVLQALERFLNRLQAFRSALETSDGARLEALLREALTIRENLTP